ncbi:MAG TPA: hypothetical protein VGF06_06350 [Terriglobales bacterium]|jgi:hypothetical protein
MRLLLTRIAVRASLLSLLAASGSAATAVKQLDLQKDLCNLSAQQPNNDPLAGVDFLSEQEVVVYTICNSGEPILSRRDAPMSASPIHLKAVIVDATSGTVIRKFDWPTSGRGSMVRVTHAGDLLVVRDNLLELLDREGKPKAVVRIPKVSDSDMTFVGLSPALDTLVVTESSEAPGGKTVNGVAILDSNNLEPIAQFHDDGDSWNIAATRSSVVRTSANASRVEVGELAGKNQIKAEWKAVWTHSNAPIPRPLFRNSTEFMFLSGNSLQLYTVSGKARDRVECISAMKAAVSRDGKVVAAACIPVPANNAAVLAGARRIVSLEITADDSQKGDENSNLITVDAYSGSSLHQISHGIRTWVEPGFDLAVSTSGSRIAIMDRLGLKMFPLQ